MWSKEHAEEVLKSKPLTFGDVDQIQAVKTLTAEPSVLGMGKYLVRVSISGEFDIEVEADSEEEAKDIALEDWQDEAEVDAWDVKCIEKPSAEEEAA